MIRKDKFSEEHTVKFTKTTRIGRLRKFATFLPKEAPIFVTVTASFWGVAKAISEIGGHGLDLNKLAIPTLVTAFSAALYKAVQKFRKRTPESLLSESIESKNIYRKGRSGWQFSLALQMLEERIRSLDRTLERIENGAQFISPRNISESEYLAWLTPRLEAIIRLVQAVSVQCTSELPSVLANPSTDTFLVNLKDSITQLSELYKITVDFELESRSINPPDRLIHAHEMTFGWTNTIRNGISEFLDILERISNINPRIPRSADSPTFSIKFEPPKNIGSFTEEIKRLHESR